MKTAEKTGRTNFLSLDHFLKILVQVGLNFFKNFGPRPKFLEEQNFLTSQLACAGTDKMT